jgi:hypothetical protein
MPKLPPGGEEMRNADAPEVSPETKREFRRLTEEWKASHGPQSTIRSMTAHPAYRAIIALGEPAIPLILDELVRDVDHWFSALKAITGANPVRPEDRGNLVKMAESWVEWDRSNGYAVSLGTPVVEEAELEQMADGGG